MERLETKKISGHTYYYYSEWGWVDGKCRRLWQRYLGKLEDIVKACESGGQAPLYADVFQRGLPVALWKVTTFRTSFTKIMVTTSFSKNAAMV